jgi:hypothetical protein
VPNRNGIYVGAQGDTSNASEIRTGLLSPARSSQTSMPFVTPGNTTESYLLRKLEGDFCGVDCKGGDCGARMPKNSDPLEAAQMGVIQSWIANGAPDN